MKCTYPVVFALVALSVLTPGMCGRSSSERPSSSSAESDSDSDTSSGDKDNTSVKEGYFDGDKRPHCKGNGDRYCDKLWDVSCPSECKKACKDADDDSDSSENTFDGIRSDLRNALKKRLFDQVFIDGKEFCVANCKSNRGECIEWKKDGGDKWCKGIKCKKGIDGCHQTYDFEKLNCGVCKIMFKRC